MEHADVVIIGGGVIGVSIAFHLAEAGVDVMLLERAELGSGSSGKGAGGVRAMFSDELNVRIGLRSLEAWGDFGRRPGAELDLERVGYLFLLSRPEELARFERDVEMQNRLGLPSRMITLSEAAELSPAAGLEGIVGAAWCPLAGHATPDAAVQGYAAGAREHGARIRTRQEADAIELRDGRVQSVRAGGSRVRTGTVVCAAGPWSQEVGRLAGVELPVRPERRRIAFTAPLAGLPERIPMTIDFESGFYFHREGRGLLFGTGSSAEQELDWLEGAAPVLARRAPILADAPLAGSWTGLYELTPDNNALLGEAAHPSRFLYATGFSGHGFQQAPAIGEIVRDLFLGRAPFLDPAPLAADRLGREGPRAEHTVV